MTLPNSGTWSFNGIPLNGVPPHKVARLGMVRTFQLTKALYRLTVIEKYGSRSAWSER